MRESTQTKRESYNEREHPDKERELQWERAPRQRELVTVVFQVGGWVDGPAAHHPEKNTHMLKKHWNGCRNKREHEEDRRKTGWKYKKLKNRHLKVKRQLYICIYIHIYMCIYIHTHTHTYIYICVYIYIDTHTHIYIYTHTHIHIYIYTHTYIYMCVYIYIYTHTHIYIYTHTHIYIYIYIGFKTFFYVVRHLDSTASYLSTGLHLGFFRSWPSLYLPSSLRCDIPVVLVKSQNETADAWKSKHNYIYIYIADGGNS